MPTWRVSPLYSKKIIKNAGQELAGGSSDNHIFDVVNNWRAAHGVPLNAIQMGLRRAARSIDQDCDIVQRIKRLSSIRDKLQRTPILLTQMQDLGGCRAVVSDNSIAHKLYNHYLSSSRINHLIWGSNDYVSRPALSGYRGYHLKMKYQTRNAENSSYNGMRIEIQVRSQLQHVWATAVEIVGAMRGEALKSGRGNADWLRLFQLMGSVVARRERTNPVPSTPKNYRKLLGELRHLERKLDATNCLLGWTTGMIQIGDITGYAGRYIFIIDLDKVNKTTTLFTFTYNKLLRAMEKYKQMELALEEEDYSDHDIVIVGADSVAALRRAYPNYYIDTDLFLQMFQHALS